MLYYEERPQGSTGPCDKDGEWHVGKPAPFPPMLVGPNWLVQADGDELHYIRMNFEGIRITHAYVQIWTGDDATFILNNLEHAAPYDPKPGETSADVRNQQTQR